MAEITKFESVASHKSFHNATRNIHREFNYISFQSTFTGLQHIVQNDQCYAEEWFLIKLENSEFRFLKNIFLSSLSYNEIGTLLIGENFDFLCLVDLPVLESRIQKRKNHMISVSLLFSLLVH